MITKVMAESNGSILAYWWHLKEIFIQRFLEDSGHTMGEFPEVTEIIPNEEQQKTTSVYRSGICLSVDNLINLPWEINSFTTWRTHMTKFAESSPSTN